MEELPAEIVEKPTNSTNAHPPSDPDNADASDDPSSVPDADADDVQSGSRDGVSGSDVDDEDTDYDSEMDEPRFKYKRILNDVHKMFVEDAASCLAVHTRFMAVGTERGRVYVFDHSGNQMRNHNQPEAPVVCFDLHQVTVNAVCIDRTGEYVASCSNDGKIYIYAVANTDLNQVEAIHMDRPVKSVAMDDNFAKNQIFASGERALILHERGLFNKHKQNLIYSGKERDGFIHALNAQYGYVCFANETGVRVYDRNNRQIITHVRREHSIELRSELCPAHICWLDSSSFVIAWANTVNVCAIRANPVGMHMAAASDLPSKLVEIRYSWNLQSHLACGIAYATNKEVPDTPWTELVLFCVTGHNQVQNKSVGSTVSDDEIDRPTFPRVRLLQPVSFSDYDMISEDIIEMNDCSKLMCHNYHLCQEPGENTYFLLCNRDMIEVRPCSADDHMDWLLDNGYFERALTFAQHNNTRVNYTTVGLELMKHYLDEEQFEEAAKLCPQVCAHRKDLWESWINAFDARGLVHLIADVMPTTDPQLEPECYETVLNHYLADDVDAFRRMVKKWTPDLYRVGGVIAATLARMQRKQIEPAVHDGLLLTLATLYTYERRYDRALDIYLLLKDRHVFQLIDTYRLFPQVKEKIRELMAIDSDVAIRLLLENEDQMPPSTVIMQLTKTPKLQLAYLQKLFARNEGAEFADMAVQLFAVYDPKKLLGFLRRSENYNLERALDVCKANRLTQEVVFLLGRSGNRRDALMVIVSELKDMIQAITFCKEHDDQDLWMDLIRWATQKPDTITTLLQHIGTHVDPVIILRQIPLDMEIVGLRNSIVKILHDYTQQTQLQEGCLRTYLSDCHQLLERLCGRRQRGVAIDSTTDCGLCRLTLLRVRHSGQGQQPPMAMFTCGHTFHQSCVIERQMHSCTLCTSR